MAHILPEHICTFIQKNHVVSLACQAEQQIWCASCFYTFDITNNRLIILTNRNTLHGSLMQKQPIIAGSIAGQPTSIVDIEGIQFQAYVKILEKNDAERALALYYQQHPYAQKMKSDVWEISFKRVKYTSNKVHFAEKDEWQA